jgi:hypothetical protein
MRMTAACSSSSEEEADGGVAHDAQITDDAQLVKLNQRIEYCKNTETVWRFASERSVLAEKILKKKTAVVDQLKEELKEENHNAF